MGGAEQMDLALEALYNALSLNPLGFPSAGYKDIRLARTRIVMHGREVIPALSIRFRTVAQQTVSLLHVEITAPDDMEPSDVWPWQ
jgi:hypothetical protein